MAGWLGVFSQLCGRRSDVGYLPSLSSPCFHTCSGDAPYSLFSPAILKMLWHDVMVVGYGKRHAILKIGHACATPKLLVLLLGPPFARTLLATLPLQPSGPANKIYPDTAESSSGFDS